MLILLLFGGLFGAGSTTTPCRGTPRVVSHRGVDEDERGPVPSTLLRIIAILDDGFDPVDLDLFWHPAVAGTSLLATHRP